MPFQIMEVEIRRNGKIYKQVYSRGKTVTLLTEIGESRKLVLKLCLSRSEIFDEVILILERLSTD